jgi:glycerol-3-phosphate dehydrogenase
LSRDDVILTYCGVRPLPSANGKDIGDVSRDHSICRDLLPGTSVPVLSLVGGKWTTFRAFSEQSCDAVLGLLGKERRISTVDLSIGGGKNYPQTEAGRAHMGATLGPRGHDLLERYGTTALTLQRHIAATADSPLASLSNYSRNEVDYICRYEHVRRLADLLLRRTAITMEGHLSDEVIREAGDIAAKALGWDKKRLAAEIEFAREQMARRDVRNARPA